MQIHVNDLKAALHTCAKNDVRYYLNGVLIKAENGKLAIVSTDGSILYYSCNPVGDCEDCEIIIPSDAVKMATTSLLKHQEYVEFSPTANTLGQVTFSPVAGEYPYYKSVIPKPYDISEDNKSADRFDPRLLMRAHKALAASNGASANKCLPYPLRHNKLSHGAAIMQGKDTSRFVIVMPYKAKDIKPFLGVEV